MSDVSFTWLPVSSIEQFFGYLPSDFLPLVKQGTYFWVQSELQAVFWAACKEYEVRGELTGMLQIVEYKGYLKAAVNWMGLGSAGDYSALRQHVNAYSSNIDAELQELAYEMYISAYEKETCFAMPSFDTQTQLSCLASLLNLTVLTFDSSWAPKYTLPVFSSEAHSTVVALKVMDNCSVCFGLNSPGECFLGDCFHRMLTGYRTLYALIKQEKLPNEAYAVIRTQAEECKAAALRMAPMLNKLTKASKEAVMRMQFEVTRCHHQEIGVRLKCLHWVCRRCVFLQNQFEGMPSWVPGAICKCPNCPQSLSIPEISSLFSDADFRQLLERFSFCCRCFFVAPDKAIVRLPCGHKGCFPCVLRAVYDRSAVCGLCEGVLPKGFLKTMPTMQCDVCHHNQPAASFPPVGCEGLLACGYCFSSAATCPHVNHNFHALRDTDVPFLQRFFFECSSCRQTLNRRFLFTKAACLCLSCHSCAIGRMSESGNWEHCPFCAESVAQKYLKEVETEVKAAQLLKKAEGKEDQSSSVAIIEGAREERKKEGIEVKPDEAKGEEAKVEEAKAEEAKAEESESEEEDGGERAEGEKAEEAKGEEPKAQEPKGKNRKRKNRRQKKEGPK